MTQQVAYVFAGDYYEHHPNLSWTSGAGLLPQYSSNAMFVQRLDNIQEPEYELTTSDGTELVWINNPGQGGWVYPNTSPGVLPTVPSIPNWYPNTFPGAGPNLTWPPQFTLPRDKNVDTEFKITQFLRYRFTADLFVSVGEEPVCKCGSKSCSKSSLTAETVDVIIDGHRDDVFVSEEKTMFLPILQCMDCQESYYHLSLIREYV